MLEKAKEMMAVLLESLGDGESIEAITMGSSYQDAGELGVIFSVNLEIQFKAEARKPKPTAKRDGVAH